MTQPPGGSTTSEAVCFRHGNRPTNVRCQNCGKPICADCMRDSPVGYRCPDCAPQSRFALADDLLVTKTIIGINVLVFVVGILLQVVDGAVGNFVMSSGGTLTEQGALVVDRCAAGIVQGGQVTLCTDEIGVANGEWWRLITSGFLHSGLLHIAFNMYFIWMFGQLLEPALGRLRFSLVYLVCLLAGSIGAMLYSSPETLTVGASGAAFGLLGAALVVAKIRKLESLTSDLLMLAALNFAIGFIPGLNISIGGHVGGFLMGCAAGFIAFGPLARNRQLVSTILAGLCVVMFVAGIVVANFRAL